MRALAPSTYRRRPPRPGWSPCSPAPTWRRTAWRRCGPCGRFVPVTVRPWPSRRASRSRARRCGMWANRWRRSSPKPLPRRRMRPRPSRSITRRCPPSPMRARRRRGTRRSCMRRHPAMSAFVGRAATKPRCARRCNRPRTRSRSISSTIAWSARRSSRAPSSPHPSPAPTSSRSIPRPRRPITSAAR